MKFLEAKDELKKLANRHYHSIKYELTENAWGHLESQCQLYIDPRISSNGKTWGEAIHELKIKLGLIPKVDLSEAPEEEIKKEE